MPRPSIKAPGVQTCLHFSRLAAPLYAAIAFGVCGCAIGDARHPSHSASDLPPNLNPTLRGAIEPDLSALPQETRDAHAGSTAAYYELPVSLCQCRAVERSTIGELLARERRVLHCAAHRPLDCVLRLQTQLVAAAEHDARNRAAAGALEAFYKLAELEAQLDLVDRGLTEAEATLARIATVRAEGVPVPFDDTELIRTRLDLAAKRIEIVGGIDRANAALKSLLDLSLETTDRLWPVDDWKATPADFDVELEIARGLAHSAELETARHLQSSLSPDTLATARATVGKIEGLAGMSPAAAPVVDFLRSLIGRSTVAERESSSRRRQIAEYADRREVELAGEIRQRISAVSQAIALVGLARDELAARRARLRELEAKADTGQSTFVEIGQARLAALESQGGTIERLMAWKIALVKLRETQGQLVEECSPRKSANE